MVAFGSRGLRLIRRAGGALRRRVRPELFTPAGVAQALRLQRLRRLPLAAWQPQQQVRVPSTDVDRPAFPVVDAHNHLGRWLTGDGGWMISDVEALVRMLDDCGVRTVVNLDGRWGEELTANLDRYDRAHPGRFVTFCHVDWSLLGGPDAEQRLIAGLEDSARRGARGVKVWKDLGLRFRDASGALVLPDDPRVIRVLQRAGELGLPVLIHTADPLAFFAPLDAHNERLDELVQVPDWWYGDRARFPSVDRLLTALETLVLATPGTQYIGAHVGCVAEDLDRVESLLRRAPNWSVDLGGRLAELGRQPRRFRALLDRHPDRVLFGTDAFPVTADAYRVMYRFLETADESFDYAPGEAAPPQGRWRISGADLPAESLHAVYAGNAERLLGL